MEQKVRILIAKPGLDGHDRGAKVVARALRDAGFEVIYTGCHQTAEQIVNAAIQEDVDGLGMSILSGAHRYLFPRVVEILKENKADDVKVFGGGIIPQVPLQKISSPGSNKTSSPRLNGEPRALLRLRRNFLYRGEGHSHGGENPARRNLPGRDSDVPRR
jgi:methylmalonyl-CoA mutase C-terminal domain/subunit